MKLLKKIAKKLKEIFEEDKISKKKANWWLWGGRIMVISLIGFGVIAAVLGWIK